jgi:citrate synthase
MGGTAKLVDAAAAARLLGVRRDTLYAYVSRGLVRSVPHPEDPRARLYAIADLEALQSRKLRLRRPKAAAATALDWGLPVLQTAISSIEGGRLRYRGRDVAQLAETATLETTAALLWEAPEVVFTTGFTPPPTWRRVAAELDPAASPIERALALLPLLLPQDVSPLALARERLPSRAAMLMQALAAGLVDAPARRDGEAQPLHRVLAAAWRRPQSADVIRRLLVLCADHELNPSTFAVRVAASTGTKLSGVLLAGLATLSGPRHGGVAERLAAILDDAGDPRVVPAMVAGRLARGEALPGFGHPLYPDGDPRAALLLRVVTPDSVARSLMQAAADLAGLAPNIDFALVATERRHALPRGAALAIFALGRAAGWFAHALEQIEMGTLIRPRAEFVSR